MLLATTLSFDNYLPLCREELVWCLLTFGGR